MKSRSLDTMIPSLCRALLGLALLLVVMAPRSAAAPRDAVVGDGTPESCTLAALQAALAGGGRISFACGPNPHEIIINQQTITLDTVIDGGGLITLRGHGSRHFVVNTGVRLTLLDLTLRDGFANGDGGAIFNRGILVIENSVLRNNQTGVSFSGGAIVNYGDLTISDSLLEGNSGGGGGAVYPRWASSRTLIVDSILRDNHAVSPTSGWGGALLTWDGAVVVIEDSDLSLNTAVVGGAVFNTTNSEITIRRSVLNQNQASQRGGAIANYQHLIIQNSTIAGNSSYYEGGGIYSPGGAIEIDSSRIVANVLTFVEGMGANIANVYTYLGNNQYRYSSLKLTNSTVAEGNAPLYGGGIFTNGDLDIANTSVISNTAGGNGGGIYMMTETQGKVTLQNSTLADNNAGNHGGGIYKASGALGISSSTINNNVSQQSGGNIFMELEQGANTEVLGTIVANGDCVQNATISQGYNLESGETCGFDQASDQVNTDPLLQALAANGGPTLTHLPGAGSPAVDAFASFDCPALDQRGFERPAGAACDIGAVESGSQPPSSTLRCGGEFTADADAMLDETAPAQVYGAETQLSLGRSAAGRKLLLLRFTLDGLPPEAVIASAEIDLPLLAASDPSAIPVAAQEVTTGWDEETAAWDNQPGAGFIYDARTYAGYDDHLRVDVTALAIRWANDGLPQLGVILGPGGEADMEASVASREHADAQPRLIIHCTPRYEGNPPDRSAADQAQTDDLARLAQISTATPEVKLGLQGGVENATFALQVPAGVSGDNENRARWFLNEFRGLLRLTDPESELELTQRNDTNLDLRFRQLLDGVPVEGGELVVHLAGDHVVGLTGFYMPDLVSLGAPALPPGLAGELARAASGNGSSSQGEPQLRYLTAQMYNPAADPRPRLAWLVSASGGEGWYHALIDAHSGRLLATLPQQSTAFDLGLRRAFGAAATSNCNSPVTGTTWYTEDGRVQGAAPDADSEAGFNAVRNTYNYWANTKGMRRDGIDGAGALINMYVGVGAGWLNAQFWCNQMEFGAGMVMQDIVAHEWAHGMMGFTVYPTYQRESGALNESLSDIFGYALDSEDWTIGEGSAAGTLRSMENPAAFADPDHWSGFQSFPATTVCAVGNDNCGVHSNSGIHNKAEQLLIEGGEHNGVRVTGMGISKTVALYYNALRLNQITANSGFLAMRDGLINTIQLSRVPFITIDLGWTYTDSNLCSIRNAYAAVGVGAGDADCDGTENPGESQWWADADNDGIRNDLDRCPNLNSGNNNDADGDTVGDPCDPDDDNDAICDEGGPLSGNIPGVPAGGCQRGRGAGAGFVFDNCQFVRNRDQRDADADNLGDLCDDDLDNDGRVNAQDNCPTIRQGVVRGDWNDFDGDGVGDPCDLDGDNDGVCNVGGPLPAGPSFPGVPVGGCRAGPPDGVGAAGDVCPLARDPGQEDTTETGQGQPADHVGDACDLCPNVSDADNTDTDGDGVADPCDQDDDNDHICDLGGPFLPGAGGVIPDPRFPGSGCEPGPLRKTPPLVAGDNCPKIANQNQRDDDNNGIGFECDQAERDVYWGSLAGRFRRYQIKPRLGPQRFPIPICPQCGLRSLPFKYESVITVVVPQGYRAQVVDRFGSVLATGVESNGLTQMHFLPAANSLRQVGGISALAAESPLAARATAAEVSYFVELIPDASLDPEIEVEVTVLIEEAIPTSLYLPWVAR